MEIAPANALASMILTVLCSLLRNAKSASVIKTLTDFYTGGALIPGSSVLGAADDAVGLPVDSWSLENWSVEKYEALFAKIKGGELVVDNTAIADPADMGLANVEFK